MTLAESSGLTTDIGDWVFHAACEQLQRWRAQGHEVGWPGLQICINQSPLQLLREGEAAGAWLRHLQALDLPANAIVLDLTEDVLQAAGSSVVRRLYELRQAGVQVALDDFGSGLASLTQLQQCGIDYLKIDGAFIRRLAPGASELALSEAMVTVAHKLGMRVIAEGVETPAQRALLLGMGCDEAQGFLFSTPLAIEDFNLHWLTQYSLAT